MGYTFGERGFKFKKSIWVGYTFGELRFKFGKSIGVRVYLLGMGNEVREIVWGWGIHLGNGDLSLGNRLGLGYTFGEWEIKFGKSIGFGIYI